VPKKNYPVADGLNIEATWNRFVGLNSIYIYIVFLQIYFIIHYNDSIVAKYRLEAYF